MTGTHRIKHEVIFYTYPKFLFSWPLIAMGYLLWFVDNWKISTSENSVWLNSETLAWIWIITLLVVIITVGFDLSRNFTIFWLVLIIGTLFLILWLKDVHGVKIFRQIYDFFNDLDPVYSRSLGMIVSIVLTLLYLIMWIWSRLNSKWRITHNEFEHYQFGRMDDSLARGAKRVRTSYPDFFELLICLAGDLIIFDSTGRRELRRICHVPMLPLVRKKINRLLEKTAITAGELDDEASDSEVADDGSDRNI